MIKYYVKCVETCPVCLGRKENIINNKWEPCKKCNGTGEYIHEVDLETAMRHEHYDGSGSMRC